MERGSLLPYHEGSYLLALDATYHTLIDFGGHYEDVDKNLITTACREASEESFGLLSYQPYDIIEMGQEYLAGNTALYVVPLLRSITPKDFASMVLQAQGQGLKVESDNILWLTREEIESYLNYPHLWYPPTHEVVRAVFKSTFYL